MVTVGVTSERGFEEQDHIPALQTFKMKTGGATVGTLVLMEDHVLGSFHHAGRVINTTWHKWTETCTVCLISTNAKT